MAKHNSIDLSLRTQELSLLFYQYHRQSGGIWYIKNNSGQIIDCSDDFLSFFKINKNSLMTDAGYAVHSFLGELTDTFLNYERNITFVMPRIILFVVMNIDETLTPVVVTLRKTDIGIYVKIDSLFFMGVENVILENIGVKKRFSFNKEIKLERLYGINPFSSMDEKEWCVAWLMSVGLSKSEIAAYLNVSETVIKKRMGKIYRILLLKNYNNFMYVSNLLLWRRFVPACLLNKSSISVLHLGF
ncbi:hypothetical protein QUQ76_004515 [Escherichia coli]|nr:hypothetical protein [Escherichia coli]